MELTVKLLAESSLVLANEISNVSHPNARSIAEKSFNQRNAAILGDINLDYQRALFFKRS